MAVAATATDRVSLTVPPGWVLALFRVTGAVLTLAMAAIHVYLWAQGYRDVPIIGVLFLLNGIGGGLLTVLLLVTPRGVLSPLSGLGALFTVGSLAALILSLTVGLFGFREFLQAPYVASSLAVESLGSLVLIALAALTWPAFRGMSWTRRSG